MEVIPNLLPLRLPHPRPAVATTKSTPIFRNVEKEHAHTASLVRCRYREIVVTMEAPSEGPPRQITESQRALELRKFFAPYLNTRVAPGFEKESLCGDGALSAYAETVIWRLRGVHVMVSLVDRAEQYFIAGATHLDTSDGEVADTTSWFGCSTVPTPGGLCENTLAFDCIKDPYPCFIINDLSLDERFASLPIVNGALAAYRFYAGTPITTGHGINIGSFFVFDDKPRNGLTLKERSFLWQQARNIMRYLETKREAAERRRIALMSQGISKFLERTTGVTELTSREPSVTPDDASQEDKFDPSSPDTQAIKPTRNAITLRRPHRGNESVLDKIRLTLDHAAEVLRESLELTTGGVVFLDTTIGYTDSRESVVYTHEIERTGEEGIFENGAATPSFSRHNENIGRHLSKHSVRNSTDKHKPAKIQAMSAADVATWDHKSKVLDGKTLHSLIMSYPKGNIWYIDDEGFFASLEQVNDLANSAATSTFGRRRSVPTVDVSKQNVEAAMLSQIFHKARQIIFLPLWDAGADRWYSGCFVWSQSLVPVFTMESEVAYLQAFTNSVMVEISRLDAITADKMKSDFISSISHEFRSPLHGVLASAEFLRDSDLTASQLEFISTIQNCSGTLLDTINHVLDYSKINSFEKAGNKPGTILNELYQTANLALLCEDLINGMIAAGEWAGSADTSILVSSNRRDKRRISHSHTRHSVEVILDIEHFDWDSGFKVQAGALRRVIMNIFGNAQKYTDSGYILVEVGIRKSRLDGLQRTANTPYEVLLIHIRDSGRGMSSEYMERKLYHPFAQENPFAPGVGLGLSIVWSIINQLGGKIHIRSEIGKGTDVEITLPVDRPDGTEVGQLDDLAKISANAQDAITTLRARVAGKSVMISRHTQNADSFRHRDISWNCIERYCVDWYGYQVVTADDNQSQTTVDLVITDHDEDWVSSNSELLDGRQVLVVHDNMICKQRHRQGQRPVGTICTPIGPFKLARCILDLLDQEISLQGTKPSNTSDRGTQTPLAEDRLMTNGMPVTDYGFTVPINTPLVSPLTTAPPPIDASIPLGSIVALPPQPSSIQDEGATQALANLSDIPLRMPTRLTKRIQTAPLVPTVLKTQVCPSPSPTRNPTSPLHILAVDDNALNLQLIYRYLLKRKMDTIITAVNGVEAVAAVREAANKGRSFDVIFMDISMPEMDGFEATRLIRSFERSFAHRSISKEAGYFNLGAWNAVQEDVERNGEGGDMGKGSAGERNRGRAYVVALTGLASRRDREEAESSGFDDFLTKPIAFGKIGDLLRRLSLEKGGGVGE